MDDRIRLLIDRFRERNISAIYCEDKIAALAKLLEIIPENSSVGMSGSVTLKELGLINALQVRGNTVFNQNKDGLSKEQSLEIRQKGLGADYYLASPNAVSLSGELIFFSAWGNRIAGVANAKNLIIVFGINKICPDLAQALKRAREYATPLNCERLKWSSYCHNNDFLCRQDLCLFPKYKRMCCQTLVIEAEAVMGRLQAVIVGENLGF